MKTTFVFGNDTNLLLTLAAVLRTASFVVLTFRGIEAVRDLPVLERPDLVVLCASMREEERFEVRSWIGAHVGSPPIITLLRFEEEAIGTGNFLPAADGPDALIALATRLTFG